MKRVMITGGAGFIGSHLTDHLLARGCEVLVFDNLHKQVHPLSPKWPDYTVVNADGDERPWLNQEGLTPWFGDVRDQAAVLGAMMSFRPDTVIHLAAMVGVGQSNEKIANYVSANVTGTAVLLNCICDYNKLVDDRAESLALLAEDVEVVPQEKEGEVELVPRGDDSTDLVEQPVMETQAEAEARYIAWRAETEALLAEMPTEKCLHVFVAGSMSSYGEGAYVCGWDGNASRRRGLPADCDIVPPSTRMPQPHDGRQGARPVGLDELDALLPESVYALTKADQERLALVVGKTRGLDVRVGRFFNVFGDRQALSNPYTGVGAIFAARALSGLAPRVYEDGEQSRDFIHVSDLVSGIEAIMDKGAPGNVYNIGTGKPTTIGWLASEIARQLDAPEPEITGQVRTGDIRHAFADASKLRRLGWVPVVDPVAGVEILCRWAREQDAEETHTLDAAHDDLLAAGLLKDGAE